MQNKLVVAVVVLVLVAMGAAVFYVLNEWMAGAGVALDPAFPPWLFGAAWVLGAVWLYYMIFLHGYDMMLNNIYRRPETSAFLAGLLLVLAIVLFTLSQVVTYYMLWVPGPSAQANLLVWLGYVAAGLVAFGAVAGTVGWAWYATAKR
jgi:uncharacterized protein (UPF0333 family)